jgi:hypothetical protein
MSSEAKKRNEGGGPGSQVLADCETFFAPKNCPPRLGKYSVSELR